eukprot:Gb_21571 [translate_table: standard]
MKVSDLFCGMEGSANSCRRTELSGYREDAGHLKEAQGDLLGAVTLFLHAGLPWLAADCVNNHPAYSFQEDALNYVTNGLIQAGMQEKVLNYVQLGNFLRHQLGDFLEKLGKYETAKEAYCKGHAYQEAVELARQKFPEEVAVLQEEWGDWLVNSAINHFMEAGCIIKAIESAIASRHWNKAAQILKSQNVKVTLNYHVMLAEHFETMKQYSEAENFFLAANLASRAFDMYIQANEWDLARKVLLSETAWFCMFEDDVRNVVLLMQQILNNNSYVMKVVSKHLSEVDARALHLNQGHKFEALGRFKDAEKLYLEAKEYDLAIKMYKNARMFDSMIELASKYRKESLSEMHLELAKQLEEDGLLQDAEQQYLEVDDWRSTVKMYSTHCMWEDAMRVAKNFGGVIGARQVAYAWALSLGGQSGAQLLAKMGLLEQAIDYAADTSDFDHAFDLCRASLRDKLPEVGVVCIFYFKT